MSKKNETSEKKNILKNVFFYLFGSVKYTPPGFVLKIQHKASEKGISLTRVFRRFAKIMGFLFLGIIILVLIAVGGALAFDKWKSSQPREINVDYRVTAPIVHEDMDDPIPVLQVRFQGSAAKKEMANKSVSEGLSIKPEISGSWSWIDDNVLVFQPLEEWGPGVSYKVTMSKELFPPHIRVSKLKFDFEIPGFMINVDEPEFYIDPVDASVKRVLISLRFNYPVDLDSMMGKIRISPDIKENSGTFISKDYSYELSSNETHREVYITSEPIGMPLKDVNMKIYVKEGIEIDKGYESPDGLGFIEKGESRDLRIPGIGSFVKINSLSFQLVKNEKQNYDQVLVLDTKGETPSDKLLEFFEVWQLPRDLPDLPGVKGIEYFRWDSPEFVTDEVLKLSTRIKVRALPTERENTSLHSFIINAEPGKSLYVLVKEGAPFYGGYYLAENYEEILQVREYPRELAILSEGNLLSLSGDKRLSLFSRGVNQVGYNIHRILPDDINHLVSQSNGNLSNFNFRNYNFSIDNLSKSYEENITLNMPGRNELQYFSLDMSKYLNRIPQEGLRYGLFMIEIGERRNNRSLSVMDRRLIMVSDLGMLLKTNQDGSKDLFVQSIATGLPVAGASVRILGKNGIPLSDKVTDSNGHVVFEAMNFSKKENTPTAFIVSKGEDLSFLPYEAPGRYLDYSGYDIGGVYGAGDPGQLTTQLFSDRGLYRPGDRINGAFIIKAGDWSRPLGGTPLLLNVTDPKGQLIFEESLVLSSDGFNEFSFETQDYSPTGQYSISLYLVKDRNRNVYLGGDVIKVEEFLPDRLKVGTSFSRSAKGWISPESLEAFVSVRNLYGAPAAGHKVTGTYRLNPTSLYFPQFREYHFLQPERSSMSFDEDLPEGITDEEGTLSFTLPIDSFEKASYRLNLSVDAYEKAGGRSVSSNATVLVSPLKQLVGYKADGDLGYIHKGATRKVDLIAINADLEKTALPDGRVRINRVDYVSTLVKQPSGVYKYESIEKSEVLSSRALPIAKENTSLSLDSSAPGKYIAEILDSRNNVLSRFKYTVVGEANLTRSLNRSAELEIKLDKSDYKPGESIEISISAPYAGAGLITIERDHVYSYKWFKTDSTSTIQKIDVPDSGLEGNGYVTVSFIRSPDSREIFMSPLSYGSVPFSLSKENRTQKINLDYPALVKPGEDLPITYSSNKKGRIIIYAVDEGILQVSRYRLPDPLNYFFRKRALEVSTAQILDLILPEYSVVRKFSEMGGGGGNDMLASNLNPFKRKDLEPVVFWSGILDSSPQKRTVSYKVPGYFNGSLRIMAVCVSSEAVGSTESDALVKDTFIIQPAAPLAVIPGDEFSYQATIANNMAGSGEDASIEISLETEEGLTPALRTQTLNIPEGKDAVVRFPVKVDNTLGASSLTLTASSGGESSRMVHPLSIRPAVPYRTTVYTSVLKGKSESVPIGRDLYPHFRTLNVSASYLPLGLAGGLDFYLEDYPYTCTEQLVSINFPKLYDGLVKNLNLDRESRDKDFLRTIAILQARQKSDGSFGMWTVKSDSYPLIDLYVFQFLLEAGEKGRFIPQSLLDRARERASFLADESGETAEELQIRSYAIYLLTRQGTITTRSLEELRKVLEKQEDDWKTDLTGLYMASTYSLLQMDLKSGAILKEVKRDFKKDRYLNGYHDRLSFLSQYLMILSRYEPDRLKQVSSGLLDLMANELKENHFTTFSASMALVGLQSYVDTLEGLDEKAIRIMETFKDDSTRALTLNGPILKSAEFSDEAVSIDVKNSSGQDLYYQVVQGGFDTLSPDTEQSHNIEISREIVNDEGLAVSELVLGESYDVRIRIRTTDNKTVQNVAIVDMLPACLEAQRDMIREQGNLSQGGKPFQTDYLDIREDRLVLYGTTDGDLREYVYSVKAVYTGSFQVPPLFAEAMYDNEIWALQSSSKINVKE